MQILRYSTNGRVRAVLISSLALLFIVAGANAERVVDLDDPQDLARYQKFAEELRCPKCQNQNLKDSNSPISEDLRNELARLIKEGRSDAYIKDFMVSRYGDFILYRPPVQENTLILWIGPVVMLAVGVLIFAVIVIRRSRYISQTDMVNDNETAGGESSGDNASELTEQENNTENTQQRT